MRNLEAFLEPLKGSYTNVSIVEDDVVARLVMDELPETPARFVLKLTTIGGGRFCFTTFKSYVNAKAQLYDLSSEQFTLYGCLRAAKDKKLRVVVIGVETALSPKGWYELVYAKTPKEKFDLRGSLLERIAKYSQGQE